MIIIADSLTCLKISPFLILLTIHAAGAFTSFVNNEVNCREREKLTLLKFKAELIHEYGELFTWGNPRYDGKDCCKWKGVLCDNRTNHVVELDLQGLGLQGKISPSLLELANLNYLDLSFNEFSEAQFPEFIGSLAKLQHLNLSYSGIGGTIPLSLGNLSMLRILDLSGNWFDHSNLDWLASLRSLEYLHLSYNNLAGSISNVLENITRLFHLDLSNNHLQGRIPHAIGSLISLSHLDLSYNKLQGEFPRAMGNLTCLSYLDLSYNQLQGEFPNILGNLLHLSHLALSNNELQGEFPPVSNQLNKSLIQGNLRLPYLKVLDLSTNKFSGRVPELSSCSSLRQLSLHDNMFNGTLPKSIGYLSNVEVLEVDSNHLEGLISEAHLLNLSKLRVLDLSFNSNLTVRISSSWNPSFQLTTLRLANCKLGPHFPKWLQNQKQVEVIDISNAKISDNVPHWFWDSMQMCSDMNMSYNRIYGVLPNLSSKIHLLTIDLSSNEFNGSLPLLPQEINDVYFSRNKFSGTIINFCNLSNAYNLGLSDNLFSTEISQDCFRCLMSLNYLNLANNNFLGEIPNSVRLCKLFSLHLRNNSFTGQLSRSLKNCSYLSILDLGENKFTGKIPSWLGESMPTLGVLSLKSNNLFGVLPSSLCHLTQLQVLDISWNKISGTIPNCVKNFTILSSKPKYDNTVYYGPFVLDATKIIYDSADVMWKGKIAEYVKALKQLTVVDLSSNCLTGEIPLEIASLIGLFALNLSRNNLVGSIPHDIGQLELLNFLDLSKNNLSGGIPSSLSQLSHLGILDLSFNNLSGKIPWDTHLQTFDASSYMGNPGLCGPPLVFKTCPEDVISKEPKSTNNIDEVNENEFITRGFYVSMALGFVVAFWGVSGTLFLNKWCRITILKIFISVEDWLYVNILVNRNRIQRYFEKH